MIPNFANRGGLGVAQVGSQDQSVISQYRYS
jgi:hypothetical protein